MTPADTATIGWRQCRLRESDLELCDSSVHVMVFNTQSPEAVHFVLFCRPAFVDLHIGSHLRSWQPDSASVANQKSLKLCF